MHMIFHNRDGLCWRSAFVAVPLLIAGNSPAAESNRSTLFTTSAEVVDTCRIEADRVSLAAAGETICVATGEAASSKPDPVVTIRRDASGTIVAMNIEF